ncbi:hypothetical protein D3C73_1664860 [compost metagenome]
MARIPNAQLLIQTSAMPQCSHLAVLEYSVVFAFGIVAFLLFKVLSICIVARDVGGRALTDY